MLRNHFIPMIAAMLIPAVFAGMMYMRPMFSFGCGGGYDIGNFEYIIHWRMTHKKKKHRNKFLK